MRCRIGYWKTGLALQVDEEAFEYIKIGGAAPIATLLPDRRFMFTGGRGHGGTALVKLAPSQQKRTVAGIYADAHNVKIDRGMVVGLEFPLFEIHDVPLDYSYAHDALLTEPLGPDHELPWPCDRHRRERLSADELRRQCYLRIRSHLLAGGHGYFDEVGVPREVVHIMAGGYAAVLEKARAEIEVAKARMAA